MVPKPSGAFFRDEEFGLPIYLLVGFLTLLLVVALNVALIAQPSHLCGHKPSSNLPSNFPSHSKYCSLFQLSLSLSLSVCQPSLHSSHLLFYSFLLVGVQIITFASIPMQFHSCLESQGKWFLLRILLKLVPDAK